MTTAPFPDCIFNVISPHLARIRGVSAVHVRPLEPNDNNGALGIALDSWQPVEYEIGDTGPTLANYVVTIEHLIKNANREDGYKEHRSAARSIRSMLYRDPDVVVPLRGLVHEDDDTIERLMKWDVEQRFASNDINKSFYFVSITIVTFQTSTL